jgi:hypothetical protein
MPTYTDEYTPGDIAAVESSLRTSRSPEDLIRRLRLVRGARSPSMARHAALIAVADIQAGDNHHINYDKFVDGGVLDALTAESQGRPLTPEQIQIMNQRYRSAGTPAHQSLERLYESSDKRWDR